MKKPKPKNPVRSTRSWSWSGDGWMNKSGSVKHNGIGPAVVILETGCLQRANRKVRVLVKVTEVRR